MSYTYLQAQGEESSADSFSAIIPYAPSKSTSTAERSCSNVNAMESCHGSPYGMMSPPSMARRGKAKSMSSAAGSRAKTSHALEKALDSTESEAVCGRKWRESSAKWDRDSSSWKTHRCLWEEVLPWSSVTLPAWGMMLDGECWERLTSVPPIIGNESGYLPTLRASVATHGVCWKRAEAGDHRSQIEDFLAWLSLNNGGRRVSGRTVNPDFADWLMVWPIGWSDCEPLAMDKFQQWLHSHGIFSK
jgi:hypothetical protein